MEQLEINSLFTNPQEYLEYSLTYHDETTLDIQNSITEEMHIRAYQLSKLLDPSVKVEITGQQIQFTTNPLVQPVMPSLPELQTIDQIQPTRRRDTDPKKLQILKLIEHYCQDFYREPDLYMGQMTEEGLQHNWHHYQESKNAPEDNMTLAHHMAIGKVLLNYKRILETINFGNSKASKSRELHRILKEATGEHTTEFRYCMSIRAYQLFENLPSLSINLNPFISLSYLRKMIQKEFDILKAQIDEVISNSIFTVAQP